MTAPTSGTEIFIAGSTRPVQSADYVENDPFPVEEVERSLDRLTMVAQEISEKLVLGPLPTEEAPIIAATQPGSYIVVASEGKQFLIPTALFLAAGSDPTGIGRGHNVGDIMYHAFPVAPPGWVWLKDTVQWLVKEDYPEYDAKCSAAGYPFGSTPTEVGVPAVGNFIRAWHPDNTSDPDRATRTAHGGGATVVGNVLGSKQADQLKAHLHEKGTIAAAIANAGAHAHPFSTNAFGASTGGVPSLSNAATGSTASFTTGSAGDHNHAATVTGSTASVGGAETRPANVALPLIMLVRPGDNAARHCTLGVPYSFDSSTAEADPGEGDIRFNNASAALATEMYVAKRGAFSNNLGPLFLALNGVDSVVRGIVTIFNSGQLTNSAIFTVTGEVLDNGTWLTLPVSYVGGNGSFANLTPLSVQVTLSGGSGGGGVIDHGLLLGLSDDDHPQYHNNARGDARYVRLAQVSVAGGVAALDGSGKVPSSQLPSFVDDVLEFADLASFPVTGETAKIYTALSTNRVYRWSGSTYVEISPSPGNTDAVPEGSVNLYHTAARVNALIAAAYTAADVLAKLLTVDGTGSSLDADLLDGQHGAYYRDAGNLNAGTLDVARLPALAGDVTMASGTNNVQINAGVITNTELAAGAAVANIGYTPLNAASYTAADVLAKLLTVDGAGSGLDADTLDGLSSAAFAAAVHGHAISDVSGLSAALAAKLDATAYTAADVLAKLLTVDGAGSGIDADLLDGQSSAFYAPIASPTFTGTPASTTPASLGEDSTRIATTAWVQDVVAAAVVSAGSGDVVGPASAVDNRIARFDLATGKVIQSSLASVNDTGAINTPGDVVANAFSSTFSSGSSGGIYYYARPASGTTLAGAVQSDILGDQLRIFEVGGVFRGWNLDIAAGAGGVGTKFVGMNGVPVDNALVRWDGTTGRFVQSSAATITDLGTLTNINITGTASYNEILQLRSWQNVGGTLWNRLSVAAESGAIVVDAGTEANVKIPIILAAYGGDVGVGVAPTAKLHVNGAVRMGLGSRVQSDFADFRLVNSNNTQGWRLVQTGSGTTHGPLIFQGSTDNFVASFINAMELAASGTVKLNAYTAGNLVTDASGNVYADGAVYAAAYGVSPANSAATNTTNLNAAIAAAVAAQCPVILPRGTIQLNNLATIAGNAVVLQGQGSLGGTTLSFNSTTGDCIVLSQFGHMGIRDCYITSAVRRTSGYAVKVTAGAFQPVFRDVRIDYHYNGFWIDHAANVKFDRTVLRYMHGTVGVLTLGSSGSNLVTGVTVNQLDCDNPFPLPYGPVRTWATNTTFNAGDIINVNGSVWQCVVTGASAASGTGPSTIPGTTAVDAFTANVTDNVARWRFVFNAGLDWFIQDSYSYSVSVDNSSLINGNRGFVMRDTTNAAANASRPLWFNSLNLETDHTFGNGVDLSKGEGCYIKGGWFGSSLQGRGMLIDSGYRGEVAVIGGTRVVGNWLDGVLVQSGPTQVTFSDSFFGLNSQASNATYHGINIASGVTDINVIACHSGRTPQGNGRQGYGLFAGASADRFIFTSNNFSGNATGAKSIPATSVSKIYANNVE
jgi:hypothetical protein